jgi:galactokinase
MKEKLINVLLNDFPQAEWISVSPGRVNLLEEHVDYNDGIVLPTAIDRHVVIAAKERDDRVVRLRAVNTGTEIVFSLNDLEKRVDVNNHSLPLWALYPAGVAWALENAGFTLAGIEASYNSD